MSYGAISPTFDSLKNHNFQAVPNMQQVPLNNPLPQPLNQDTVQINQNNKLEKSDNNKRNILLGIGATALTALGAVYGVRKFQAKNIKNVQKAFQETFMRDDITVEQTKEMLKRYKEIEKIKDREEYIKALFEEAKKNYGLEKSPIKLSFQDKEIASGFCQRDNSVISITPKCSRSHILNTMHHEFRHAKQHIYALPEYSVLNKCEEIIAQGKDKSLEEMEELMIKEVAPEKYLEWAKKCRTGIQEYVDADKDFVKYWNNFTEVDARQAGRTINKFVKGKAFLPINDICMDLYMKIRTFFS